MPEPSWVLPAENSCTPRKEDTFGSRQSLWPVTSQQKVPSLAARMQPWMREIVVAGKTCRRGESLRDVRRTMVMPRRHVSGHHLETIPPYVLLANP